jgi:hypothetical protein
MITKRNMIDLIQNRLSGGDTPKDLRKMYGRGTIAKILNFAYNDVCINNQDAASDMAIPYTFTPASDTKGYYITLYPQPIAGTLAFFGIEDEKDSYQIQDKTMAKAISELRGSNKGAAILFGSKLRFNKQPTGDVTITIVPNIYQMQDDDILYAGEVGGQGEMSIFQMCLQILMNPVYQDELNNNAVDAQQNGR